MEMNLRRTWITAMLAAGVALGSVMDGGAQGAEAATVSRSHLQAVNEITVTWDGKELSRKGIVSLGSSYVPITEVRDVLGLSLHYDAKERSYTLSGALHEIKIYVYGGDEIGLLVNGYYSNSKDAKLVNGRLYLPYDLLHQYMGVQGAWSSAEQTLSLTSLPQNKLILETRTLREVTPKADISVRYPVLSGMANAKAEADMNAVFRQHAEDFISESVEGLKEMPAPREGIPYEYTGDFIVHHNRDGILSLTAHEYTYAGGAHGMTYRTSWTFSLQDGKKLQLADVINLQGDRKQKLDTYVLETLEEGGGYLGGFQGVPADASFYIQGDAAVLYFQLYEYTAYAYGFPEMKLPFSVWKK
ncbi:PdaC/SigV domain-containing protein [Paenibacillus sp. JSM ZJ436]|uniref:PdaC/SigV domain-containing protein n=1 Tax=Paenibacillus sp. JSM ZJ436 TaxID=3376190 RepID=UPI0037C512C7